MQQATPRMRVRQIDAALLWLAFIGARLRGSDSSVLECTPHYV